MPLKDVNGATLTRAQVLALTAAQGNPPLTVNADIYEDTALPGTSRTELRKKFAAGETIHQADIDAIYPLPTITAIAPATGPAAGGTAVTITGTGFEAGVGSLDDVLPVPGADVTGVTVTIGGVAATAVAVVSGTKLTATTGAHAAGAVDVVVATGAGSVTLVGGFTYV